MFRNFKTKLSNTRGWTWLGYAVASLWIFGGAVFFYVRFSMVFYHANKGAIDEVALGMAEKLGLAG